MQAAVAAALEGAANTAAAARRAAVEVREREEAARR